MRRMREDHLHRNYSDVNERPIRCRAKLIQPKAGMAACLAMIPSAYNGTSCPATATSNGGSSRDPRGVKFPPSSANCDRCCRPVSPRFAQAFALGEVVSNTGASQIERTAGAAHCRTAKLFNYGAVPVFLIKCKRRSVRYLRCPPFVFERIYIEGGPTHGT